MMSRSSKGRWVVLLTVMMVFGVAGNAAAHGTVDQRSEGLHDETCLNGFTRSMAQTFTPLADNLTGVDVHMSRVQTSSAVELTIRTENATGDVVTGDVLAKVTNIPLISNEWNHIDLAGPIDLTPGNTYAIRLDHLVGDICWLRDLSDDGNSYPGGQGWNIEQGFVSDSDLNFRTYYAADNQPPVADPNGPYLVGAGASVAFDGSGSSDPDGDSLTFDWVAGAGTFDDATAVQPTYNAPAAAGTYTVTLTVDDGNATDKESTDVVVYEPDLKERKQAVLVDLSAHDPTGNDKDDKKLEKAVEHLTKSLNPDYWVDGDTLVAKDGKKVFAEESKAVKDLEKIKGTDVLGAIASLVAIDKELAQGAIKDAQDRYDAICSVPTTRECEKAAKELAKAAKEMDKAKKELAKGHSHHAIGKNKKLVTAFRRAMTKKNAVLMNLVISSFICKILFG